MRDKTPYTKHSHKAGCLIFVIVAALIILWVFWQMREPGRRARAVYDAVHPGMLPEEVISLLKGRNICVFEIKVDGRFEQKSREEFLKDLKETNHPGRLSITFLGMSPGRVSFHVEFGTDGRVTKVTELYFWD